MGPEEIGVALRGDVVLVTSPQGHAFLWGWRATRGQVRELKECIDALAGLCAVSPDGRLAVSFGREPNNLRRACSPLEDPYWHDAASLKP